MILAERSWFTGLSELFQLIGGGIGKVDVSMKRMSTIVQVSPGSSNLAAWPSLVTLYSSEKPESGIWSFPLM
jgi:hypothetical protein